MADLAIGADFTPDAVPVGADFTPDAPQGPVNAQEASPARPDSGSVAEWLQNLPQGIGQMSPEEMSRTGQTQYEPSAITAGTEPTKISEALRANVQPMLEHPISSLTGMFTNWDDVKRLYEQPQDILGPTAKRFAGMQVRPDEEIGSQNFYNTAVLAALVGAGKLGARGEPRAAEAEKPTIPPETPPIQAEPQGVAKPETPDIIEPGKAPETIPTTPSEQTRQIATSPEASAPGEIQPGQQPAEHLPQAGMGQPEPDIAGGGERPGIGVAERYANEELGPDTVVPGEIRSGEDWRGEGRAYIDSGQDHRMPIRAAVAGHVSPRNVGIVSAEYERLVQNRRLAADALEQRPNDPSLQQQFDQASGAAVAWRQEMQPVMTRWAETGHVMQGEPSVDLTTFDGLHQKAMELNGGRPLGVSQKAALMKRGAMGKNLRNDEAQAVAARDQVIQKTLPKAKLRSPEEMQAMVDNMVKRMTPCG